MKFKKVLALMLGGAVVMSMPVGASAATHTVSTASDITNVMDGTVEDDDDEITFVLQSDINCWDWRWQTQAGKTYTIDGQDKYTLSAVTINGDGVVTIDADVENYSGIALEVGGPDVTVNGYVEDIYATGGTTTITGEVGGVTAHDTAEVTVNGDVNAEAQSEDSVATGVYTSGNATVTVNGNVNAADGLGQGSYGVKTTGESTVKVTGNVYAEGDDYGAVVYSKDTSEVTVEGDVTGKTASVYDSSKLTVGGDVSELYVHSEEDNDDIFGIVDISGNVDTVFASGGCVITVGGDVNVTDYSSIDGTLTIAGDLKGSLNVMENGNLSVGGDVTGDSLSVAEGGSASVTGDVLGSVSANGTVSVGGSVASGIYMSKDATVTVDGDVTGNASAGVEIDLGTDEGAVSTGSLTVKGSVTGADAEDGQTYSGIYFYSYYPCCYEDPEDLTVGSLDEENASASVYGWLEYAVLYINAENEELSELTGAIYDSFCEKADERLAEYDYGYDEAADTYTSLSDVVPEDEADALIEEICGYYNDAVGQLKEVYPPFDFTKASVPSITVGSVSGGTGADALDCSDDEIVNVAEVLGKNIVYTISAPSTDDSNNSETPSTDDSNNDTPSTDDSNSETPSTDDSNNDTPSTDDSNNETPSTDDSNSETPSTDDSNNETPSTNDSNTAVTPSVVTPSTNTEASTSTSTSTTAKTDGTTKAPTTAAVEGTLTKDDTTGAAASVVALASDTDALKAAVLTSDEKAQMEAGKDISVWMEATDITSSVSEADQTSVTKALPANSSVGMYFDLKLYKQMEGQDAQAITNLADKITVSITVPDSLKNTDTTKTRTYQVIRIHDGSAEVLDGTYNSKTSQFSFETDKFSTYALIYHDTANAGTTLSPQTGDTGMAAVWALLGAMAGAMALAVSSRKKRNA